MEFKPEERICATCTKKDEDCSELDFEPMHKITLGFSVTTVRCTELEEEDK